MFKSSPEKISQVVSKYPCEEISIEITEECRMSCIHCSSEAGKAWRNELSFDEIKEIIILGKEYIGTKVVSLSGGDPTLRKDFVDIIKYIDSLGLNILVYSSGIYPRNGRFGERFIPFTETNDWQDIIGIMRKSGNKMIYSLEGGNKFSHEFITRTPDSWNCVIDSINGTVIEGVYCEVHTCPMTTNMYELPDMYNILSSMLVERWSLLRLVPQGRCSRVKYLLTDKKEFYDMLRIIERLIEDAVDRENRGARAIEIRVGDPLNFYGCISEKPIIPMTTCNAGKNRILIRADGETQFCAALKHSPSYDYGNCRDTNIVDLWVDSDMVNKLREFHEGKYREIQGRCNKCKYLDLCRGGCLSQRIATYGHMYRGPDPLCPAQMAE